MRLMRPPRAVRTGGHRECDRNRFTHFLVVEDAKQADTLFLLGADHLHHHGTVGGIERGGGLIQQKHCMIRDQATGDVDALLLATGEGGGRQLPEILWQVQPRQKI